MTRIVAVSDLHMHDIKLPEGDLLLIGGDHTYQGTLGEMRWFQRWLEKERPKFKSCAWINGNHEREEWLNGSAYSKEIAAATNSHYLEDSCITLEGLKIFGSSWTPRFGYWGYMYDRPTERWSCIPDDADIVMCHGPLFGILDECPSGENVGCWDLKNRIKQVQPRLFCHGHIHLQGGKHFKYMKTDVYNLAVCSESYEWKNPITVIDI